MNCYILFSATRTFDPGPRSSCQGMVSNNSIGGGYLPADDI